MFSETIAHEPGEIPGKVVFEPEKVVYVHVETRVVACRNSGENCVRAWKNSLCSRESSCGTLEELRGCLHSGPESLVMVKRKLVGKHGG